MPRAFYNRRPHLFDRPCRYDIYDPIKRIEYVRHWEVKRAELAEAMKTLDPANLQGIREGMDLYDRIRDKVSGLTSILKNINTLTPDMHRDTHFNEMYDGILKRMQEGPAAPASASPIEETKPAENAKRTMNVSATNNSIASGIIQIGGSVGGNISIGNNNQSDNK